MRARRLEAVFLGTTHLGGADRYSRNAAVALGSIAGDHGCHLSLHGLTDPPGSSFTAGGRSYDVLGYGWSKRALAVECLRRARTADMVFLGHPNLGPLGLMMRAVNPRLRYWVAAFGAEVWKPLSPLRRLALRTATRVLPVSSHTASSLESIQGVPWRKIALVPCCIEEDFAECPEAASAASGGPTILTVARLSSSERGKGVDTVIRALPALATASPGVRYRVIGGGDMHEGLKQLAARLGVDSRVTFVGEVDEAALKCAYRECDAFVMPSRQEGFGIVFLEAMAFGKPVVGCDAGGVSDVIREGENGFLVEYGDAETLAQRLTALLTDAELRRAMGERGRRLFEQEFTMARLRRRLQEELQTAGPRRHD